MGFINQKGDYYSNCFIEAVKDKLKWRSEIKLIYISSSKNEVFCPHFMWHDLLDDTIKDFHCDYYLEKWWNLYLFKGHIRVRPYSVYERWLKTKKWSDENEKALKEETN